ncbi:MAG: HAMP domain-containing protein, partial [Planctomycetales bacterium]
MKSRWSIRRKLLLCLGMLLLVVGTLSYGGFHGVYAYRSMIKGLSERVAELPAAAELGRRVGDLRVALRDLRAESTDPAIARKQFQDARLRARNAADAYRKQLSSREEHRRVVGDLREEWTAIGEIDAALSRVDQANRESAWLSLPEDYQRLREEVDELQRLTVLLPSHLHRRVRELRTQVRSQYRALIVLVWVTSVSAALMFLLFIYLFYRWLFRPLRILVKGSRQVASGNFAHRIQLHTRDEMAELAQAMNAMTDRFCAIRDDLDQQVATRTKQAIRSEKLASVGFLAAGVAHEINNPLASIAMCAESLESRLSETSQAEGSQAEDQELTRRYLRIIQSEAFRCKGITEKLRGFSRMGDRERSGADLRELVREVMDLLAHHGEYKNKTVELTPGDSPTVRVNSQEIKQVGLNLLANALDSLD